MSALLEPFPGHLEQVAHCAALEQQVDVAVQKQKSSPGGAGRPALEAERVIDFDQDPGHPARGVQVSQQPDDAARQDVVGLGIEPYQSPRTRDVAMETRNPELFEFVGSDRGPYPERIGARQRHGLALRRHRLPHLDRLGEHDRIERAAHHRALEVQPGPRQGGAGGMDGREPGA